MLKLSTNIYMYIQENNVAQTKAQGELFNNYTCKVSFLLLSINLQLSILQQLSNNSLHFVNCLCSKHRPRKKAENGHSAWHVEMVISRGI